MNNLEAPPKARPKKHHKLPPEYRVMPKNSEEKKRLFGALLSGGAGNHCRDTKLRVVLVLAIPHSAKASKLEGDHAGDHSPL